MKAGQELSVANEKKISAAVDVPSKPRGEPEYR